MAIGGVRFEGEGRGVGCAWWDRGDGGIEGVAGSLIMCFVFCVRVGCVS